jgi:formate C-acetyltransferase
VANWQPSPQIQAIYDDYLAASASLGAERAIHYTEYWKSDAARRDGACVRNARALAHHLAKRTIRIYPGEVIVGSHTEHRIGAVCHVEKAGVFMLGDLFRFEKRPVNPLAVAPGAKGALLRSAIPYWLNRNVAARSFPLRERLAYVADQLNAAEFVINEAGGIAHFLPDYETVIQLGTEGLRAKVRERIDEGGFDEEGRDYLEASLVSLTAIERFADRYRDEARRDGRDDVVEVLSHVPRRPARTLREALQTIWLFQLLIQIESLDQGISLGRMDQYLYPLFLEEEKSPDFDADRVRDLFAAFCLKLSEVVPLFSDRVTEYFAGLPTGQVVSVGGVDADGNDCTNELTYLLLDVMDGFKTRQPNWHARISARSNEAYVKRVVEVIAGGGGSPALYNDDAIMPAMVERGVDPSGVWNYSTVGCVEPALQGSSFTSSDAAIFNLAISLEMLFGDGKRLKRGKVRERPWLRDIGSTAELLEKLEEVTDRRLVDMKRSLDAIEQTNARDFPTPLSSLTIGGCIENATDATRGGAWYNASGIQGVGVADLANSLAVIEKLVFQDGKYTLEDLANASATDFGGQEELRARALKIAAFGNDDPLADELANEVVSMFDRCVSRHTNTRGGRWMPGFYAMTCHQGFGKQTAAMPSGRRSGRPLADGLAPVDGSDRLGPTASLNSVAKLDHRRFGNGMNLNVKFDSSTVAGPDGRVALEALIRGYFAQGGMQVQITVVDTNILEEAMKDPESHRNLLVRVSGYCAYFVDLTPGMQQEMIDRTRQRA